MLSPVVDQVAEENPNIKVCKVNVDEEQQLAIKYGVYTWVGRRYGGRAQRKKCNDSQGYSERYIGGYKRSRT